MHPLPSLLLTIDTRHIHIYRSSATMHFQFRFYRFFFIYTKNLYLMLSICHYRLQNMNDEQYLNLSFKHNYCFAFIFSQMFSRCYDGAFLDQWIYYNFFISVRGVYGKLAYRTHCEPQFLKVSIGLSSQITTIHSTENISAEKVCFVSPGNIFCLLFPVFSVCQTSKIALC